MIRTGSMCTGYGGLDLGVEAALGPVSLQWVADPDPGVSRILAHRFPDTPNHGDIRAFPWETAEPVDVLTAGFPCQPVSAAGRRAGTDDERWLFDDICDAIGRMVTRPRLLVFENVRGLLTANRGHAMARVVHGLAVLGYVGSWRALAASDIGAPHRRERVFIVAWPADTPGPGLETWRSERLGGNALADTARLGHDRPGIPRDRRAESENNGHPPTDPRHRGITERPRPTRRESGQRPTVWGELGRGRRGPTPHTDRDRLQRVERVEPGVGPREDTDGRRPGGWGAYTDAVTRWEHATGHVAPAPTEPTGRGGTHRLAPAFVEWMMGLPPGWVTDTPGLSRTAQLAALGNGVVWQQAAAAVTDLLGQ